MDCVKCTGIMAPVQVGGVEVERCEGCGGLWFDLGELDDVLEGDEAEALKKRTHASEEMDHQEASCPRCGGDGHMIPVKDREHGILVDTCTSCYGRWLDAGEFDRLVEKGLLGDLHRFVSNLFA